MDRLINLLDFETAAIARLPAGARDYYRGGAGDEITLRANRSAWDRWAIHYRVLQDVAVRDLSVILLDRKLEWPVLIAPTAFHQLAHPEGELATARAAAAAGTTMVLSTLSNKPMEEVAIAANGNLWFQLYCYKDRAVTRDLIARAAAAGCGALVLTVDAPVGAVRERDVRNEFSFPVDLPVANLLPSGSRFSDPALGQGGFSAYINRMFDPALTWRDLEWIVSISKLPVLVKGVVRPDDARRALSRGARGVVVSNHGGRQLDSAPATADVLDSVTRACGPDALVLVDGGIRRGTDILKAIALGAKGVLIGRPVLWGLAIGGEAGVRRVLDILRHEFSVAMALAGCRTLEDVDRALLGRSFQSGA